MRQARCLFVPENDLGMYFAALLALAAYLSAAQVHQPSGAPLYDGHKIALVLTATDLSFAAAQLASALHSGKQLYNVHALRLQNITQG